MLGYRRLRVAIWVYPLLATGLLYALTSSPALTTVAFLVVAVWVGVILRLFRQGCLELGAPPAGAKDDRFSVTG